MITISALADEISADLTVQMDTCQSHGIRCIDVRGIDGVNVAKMTAQRDAVMDRMAAMVELAESAQITLLHENEKAIDGATPAGVKDLFATVRSEPLGGIFDPSNYVDEGLAPYNDVWADGLAELTDHFHIKDKVPGQNACVPAGEGAGELDLIFADLKARGWSGYMALEPHLKAAGQFAGFTRPELFAGAVAGLERVSKRNGISYA